MYTVYKGDRQETVYPIDVEDWLRDGWSLEPDEELLAEKAASGELIDINDVTLQTLKSLGLTVADSQRIIKLKGFKSVEDAIAAVPALEPHKPRLTVVIN